jgi:hypothetical protein
MWRGSSQTFAIAFFLRKENERFAVQRADVIFAPLFFEAVAEMAELVDAQDLVVL